MPNIALVPSWYNINMRTYNKLYHQIYDFQNLYSAYLSAIKYKRYKLSTLKFTNNLEENLIDLQNSLIWKTYHPSPYREFYVTDPKQRLIMAPDFRDRVLQHAIYNVIMPLFDKKFIYDSYACRRFKGTHKGADRLTYFLRKSSRQWDSVYCLKCDVSSYFPSIRHDELKLSIRKTISCKDTLVLLDTIIDSTPGTTGIPLGNLTSQLFANIYLNDFDHYVKEVLCIKYYVRYMDDFILLSKSKSVLNYVKAEIMGYFYTKGLSLNRKTSIFPISQGIDFLGYRIWPTHRLLRKSSIRRAKRKFKVFSKRYKEGKISYYKIKQSVMSWLGHARHCNSYYIRFKVLSSAILQK